MPESEKPLERLRSLDAYRGFVMLLMASAGFGIAEVAKAHPDSSIWQFLGYQTGHAEWEGCTLWDLLQPSFMFIVGVALPFSFAARRARGMSYGRILGHSAWRAFALIALAIFLTSNWSQRTDFIFTNVLAQIGLGYLFVFLFLGRGFKVQLAVAATVLAATWLLFVLHPAPPPGFDYTTVNAGRDFQPWTGLFAHWNKNTNFASSFDAWFLQLFPRDSFKPNEGGYTTLNFVPATVTMLFGLMAGELLRSDRRAAAKAWSLAGAGVLCLALGAFLGATVCPIVKRLWTPSWTIYSTGWTCLLLAAFYGIIEIAGFRRWAFPLVVVGMNSIVMYSMAHLLRPWTANSIKIHLGRTIFDGEYGPIAQSLAVLFAFWLVCLWLFRRKIFIRI